VSRQTLSRKAPCPWCSGKTCGRCCHGKHFDYLVNEEDTIVNSVPMNDELADVIEKQKCGFIEEDVREPGSDNNLFFDMPPLEHAVHFMVEAMKRAGWDPAVVYAFEKTGLIVTGTNEHLISDKERAEWEAAVREYRLKQWEESGDQENDWF